MSSLIDSSLSLIDPDAMLSIGTTFAVLLYTLCDLSNLLDEELFLGN